MHLDFRIWNLFCLVVLTIWRSFTNNALTQDFIIP